MRFLLIAFAILFSSPAHAACLSPAGVEGELLYNSAQNVPQVCNGTDWMALGRLNPGAGGAGCNNPAGTEGEMIYSTDFHVLQYCDGDDWVATHGFDADGTYGPPDCPDPSNICNDGTIYVGRSPAFFNQNLFISPNEQGSAVWSTENIDTQTDSRTDGRVNQDWIVNNRTISNYPAFELCVNETMHGHADWYLPARNEFFLLAVHQESIIPSLNHNPIENGDWYKISSNGNDSSDPAADTRNRFYGGDSGTTKSAAHQVICFRRE